MRFSFPVTTAVNTHPLSSRSRCGQLSNEWKRGEADSVLVESGEWGQVRVGVGARAAPLYVVVYVTPYLRGATSMCVIH